MLWSIPDHFLIFPHPLSESEEGILGVGQSLSVPQVLLAYRYGIFPWYTQGDPVLWWYTQPRAVLRPDGVKVSKSMRRWLKSTPFEVSIDQAFHDVIGQCRQIRRKGQESTWIHDETVTVFEQLHRMGYAHSVEIWHDHELVGGLYGLAIGKIFFGESMFAKRSNASKMALVHLCTHLEAKGFHLIDCQQETDHLNSMGAETWSGKTFFEQLQANNLFTLEAGDHHF